MHIHIYTVILSTACLTALIAVHFPVLATNIPINQ